jgi:serine O-acetyltransferase
MHHEQHHDGLHEHTRALLKNVQKHPELAHVDRVYLPSREAVVLSTKLLRQLMFPGYFEEPGLTSETLPQRTERMIAQLDKILYEQVRYCLRYHHHIPADRHKGHECAQCDARAREFVDAFLQRLPAVRDLLATDVQAAFEGDPAAHNTDETIFCYPGLFAIMVQRLAHEFYKLDVPLLPRMMTEHAHSITAIDIHPGAKIGKGLFIDHGTGIVIGETAIVGSNVKIYQGVTLGALAPGYGQKLRGQRRHPTIEDDVTIYAGATILGGDTVIGQGSTIGGNVFLASSVPAHNVVYADPPHLKYRDRSPKSAKRGVSGDFQI